MAQKKTTKKTESEPTPKMSLVKAAIKILGESDEALNTKKIVTLAKERGLWEPGAGRTPEQTLYSAMVREIKVKGATARFKLVSRGQFALNPNRA